MYVPPGIAEKVHQLDDTPGRKPDLPEIIEDLTGMKVPVN
jgi:hypothetical protein